MGVHTSSAQDISTPHTQKETEGSAQTGFRHFLVFPGQSSWPGKVTVPTGLFGYGREENTGTSSCCINMRVPSDGVASLASQSMCAPRGGAGVTLGYGGRHFSMRVSSPYSTFWCH